MSDKREELAKTIYMGHVIEHGFPNGLPQWDEMTINDEGCGNMESKTYWLSIAEFVIAMGYKKQ